MLPPPPPPTAPPLPPMPIVFRPCSLAIHEAIGAGGLRATNKTTPPSRTKTKYPIVEQVTPKAHSDACPGGESSDPPPASQQYARSKQMHLLILVQRSRHMQNWQGICVRTCNGTHCCRNWRGQAMPVGASARHSGSTAAVPSPSRPVAHPFSTPARPQQQS